MAKPFIAIILLFWVVALVGFTPTYFLRLGDVPPVAHFHGLMLFGWYALMLIQASLIQARRNSFHRALGKVSFLWAPLIVVASLMATHAMLARDAQPLADGGLQASAYNLRLFAIILVTLVGFAFFYIQALRERRNWKLHSRYMIATGLVLLTPALVRAIAIFVLPHLVTFSDPPTLDQMTLPENVSLPLLQLFALVLLINDWRKGQEVRPYGYCLLALVLNQAALNWLPGQEWWSDFGTAFLALPLG